MGKASSVDVFEYSDFRLFVKDKIEDLKQNSSDFSFRKFCKVAGIASPGLIYLIIQGKTAVSEKTALKLSKGFKFSRAETQFFIHLVNFCQSKNPEEKKAYFERMLGEKSYQRFHPLAKEQFAYYSRWYYPVIRELIGMKCFKPDAEQIAQQLGSGLKASEVSEALRDLLRLGLIRLKSNSFEQTSGAVTTGDELDAVDGIALFHLSMMDKAKEALSKFDVIDREISSLTLTVDESQMKEIKEELIKFRKSIFRKYGEVQASHTQIVQMNVQLFPLMKLEP